MSWIPIERRTSRTLRARAGMCAALLVSGTVMATAAMAQDAALLRWPRELESRAPTLFNGIESDFGERPRGIFFYGRDTLNIIFVEPRFWARDMDSTEVPQASLPVVAESAQHLAWYMWNNFAREAGINYMRFTFVRRRRAHNVLIPNKDVSSQQVTASFSREALETGRPERPLLGIVERDDSWKVIEVGRYCLLAPKATVLRCVDP